MEKKYKRERDEWPNVAAGEENGVVGACYQHRRS
jgi:hypothetical protein